MANDRPSEEPASHAPFLIVVLAAAGILAFAFQGSRGLHSPDEGYYGCIAQAMIETGDFAIPRLHGDIWLDKPPLSIWGCAAGMLVLGQNEWGARAFVALSYALTVLLVYLLGQSIGTKERGLSAALMYATMLVPFGAANALTPDTPLALWTTASFLCFWESVKPNARRVILWKMLMCAAFGLGFLTKGPAALIPAGAMLAYLIASKQALRYFATPWTALGIGLFAGLGLGWYALTAYEIPGALDFIWDNQVLGRTVSSNLNRNPDFGGIAVYAAALLAGTLPWSVSWWPALWRSGGRIFQISYWRSRVLEDPANLLLATWIAVPTIALCLASSRLILYMLPVFPALALATAQVRASGMRRESWPGDPYDWSRFRSVFMFLWIGALLALRLMQANISTNKDMRALYQSMKDHMPEGTREIVSYKEPLEGLGFYAGVDVKRATKTENRYLFFVPFPDRKDKLKEIPAADAIYVIVAKDERHTDYMRGRLELAGIPFDETELDHEYRMFVCRPAKTGKSP